MKQLLGSKKTQRIEDALALWLGERVPILSAYTRGGWGHGWAEVWVAKSMYFMVNFNDGTVEVPTYPQILGDYDDWVKRFPRIATAAEEQKREDADARALKGATLT